MALPSVVTLGSLAFVVGAGVGLVLVSTTPGEESKPSASAETAVSKSPDSSVSADDHTPGKPRGHHRVDVIPKTLVDVYNNSGISGLATAQAAYLQGAGWNIAATDNWYGNIPDNTVYFPPKKRTDAAKLAQALGYTRLRPAVSPMHFDRLTVIITSAV